MLSVHSWETGVLSKLGSVHTLSVHSRETGVLSVRSLLGLFSLVLSSSENCKSCLAQLVIGV